MIKAVLYLDKDNTCCQKQLSNMKMRDGYAGLTTRKF